MTAERVEAGSGAADRAVDIVRAELAALPDPCSIATGVPISLTDMGIVKSVEATAAGAHVVFQLTSPVCLQIGLVIETLDQRCKERGVQVTTEVDPDSEWLPHMIEAGARRRLRALRPLPLVATVDNHTEE